QATVGAVVEALTQKLADSEPLQGLIADASASDAIVVNLGRKHGVAEGMVFNILEEGAPIEVGGRVIAHRQRPVGRVTLTTVEDDYAIGTASNLSEGVTLVKEMKI